MPVVQQIQGVVNEVDVVPLIANRTVSIPAKSQFLSVLMRETNGLTIPQGLIVGTTDGGQEAMDGGSGNPIRITANVIASSVSTTALITIKLPAFLAVTTLYINAKLGTITGITQANPAVLTFGGSTIPGYFANGMTVDLADIVGMTELNGTSAVIANLDTVAKTFELAGVDSTGFGAYVSGGTVGGWNGASVDCTICVTSFA